jgi:hypothetical protein
MKHYNWSTLNRSDLIALFLPLGAELVGKKIRISAFQRQLSSFAKSHLPVRVVQTRDPKMTANSVAVGGYYVSSDDQAGRKSITINMAYAPGDRWIKFSAYRWRRVSRLLADTILHEIIHMRQARARQFKDLPGYESTAYYARQRRAQEYLGHSDEIGAYAFNIACELWDQFGDDWDAVRSYIDSDQARRRKRSSLHYYLKTFDWDHKHPVVRRLKTKIVYYWPRVGSGRPFANNDHLTR